MFLISQAIEPGQKSVDCDVFVARSIDSVALWKFFFQKSGNSPVIKRDDWELFIVKFV